MNLSKIIYNWCFCVQKIGFHGLNEVENNELIFLNQRGL